MVRMWSADWRVLARRPFGTLVADERGTTAIEFAMVAGPFLVLVLGIMTVGLQFFALSSLENGLSTAARQIRTGQAQKGNVTVSSLRDQICESAGSFIKCDSSLVVHLKSGSTFASLDPPISCLDGEELAASNATGTKPVSDYSGSASQAVLVTVCYDWKLGVSLWRGLWGLLSVTPVVGDKTILSATTTFRTEPYE